MKHAASPHPVRGEPATQSSLIRSGDVWRIDTPVPPAARLFGVPFLLLGLWLLKNLAGSIADVMHGLGGVGEMLPGQLLLSVLAAAFLVPGVALTMAHRHVLIDRVGNRVEDVRTFLFVRRASSVPLDRFARVRVALRIKAQKARRDTLTYDIELIPKGKGESFLLGLADSAAPALQLGRQIAHELGFTLDDHSGSDPQFDDAT